MYIGQQTTIYVPLMVPKTELSPSRPKDDDELGVTGIDIGDVSVRDSRISIRRADAETVEPGFRPSMPQTTAPGSVNDSLETGL